MAPNATTQILLSPAELSYLHASLSLSPPIRPDGRSPTQFRPLIAESDILPSPNGSARVCFADGTEAIVGVKAEVHKSDAPVIGLLDPTEAGDDDEEIDEKPTGKGMGEDQWVDMGIEVPGQRDDDPLPLFLAAMLTEALLASGELKDRLWINRRFHWKLYIDVLLLSQPLSYPLPLLSLTTHLALLDAKLPKLVSEGDEDPLFDDDWEASGYLYPLDSTGKRLDNPTITLLVISVGANIIFDPSKEELAVADAVLAVSIGVPTGSKGLQILSMRTIDPPSKLTQPGVPTALNSAAGATNVSEEEIIAARETSTDQGVWNPPRGGLSRKLIPQIMKAVLGPNGVAKEVIDGLNAVTS
ncbi:putative exoribonuclease family protein [Microthyrium microscopicum]|uniref:Ribosomal RNA-processing protein 42 n=1 Tax=Microthyrium microscopicum TaxID=703497 RepID=A0A6A6U6J3_9PEZI|nr:putative exoribonuclease family protein [Microthyrium microscopicum]